MSSKLLGGRNIRWKLWAAFMAAAAFIALFVAIILWAHMESVEDASKIEASHVAELIGDLATGKDGFEPELLKTVEQLYSSKDRDFVIVDANRKGLADKDRTGLGHRYDDDRGNEVEQTLADGKVRSFVERSSHHPDGARQVVVPVRSGPRIIGAVLVEYSPTRKKLIRAGVDEFLLIGFLGSSMVLFVLWSGWSVARQIAGPIESLTHGVSRIAERDFAIRITIVSDDELGKLGNGFNQMAAALASHRGELLALNESLDRKVVERTRELRDASLASAKANQELHYLSCYDPLTGLANKSLFVERVQNLCAADLQAPLVMCLVDIERFKNINDTLGQLAGDELLRQVARWLERASGEDAIVARVGADHFALAWPAGSDSGAASLRVQLLATGLLEQPFPLDQAIFRIAAKFGLAVAPADGSDATSLFQHAEAALKHAKASGSRFCFYTRTLSEKAAGKPSLESRLRLALERDEFVLHYQPKQCLVTGKLSGAEALIRWQDPESGLVPPGSFIPTLEETGLIHEVGRMAMRRAVGDYLAWRDKGLIVPRIAVNVSPLQLRNPLFLSEIEAVLAVDARASKGLELEITESMVMEDVQQSIVILQAIQDMGVQIALDDFGTGFSSLGYLSKLPINTLKIDRSFVINMTLTSEGMAMVSLIINLAQTLGLVTVAEGVELPEQATTLRLLKCNQLQGFLFGRPVPAQVFESNYLSRIGPELATQA